MAHCRGRCGRSSPEKQIEAGTLDLQPKTHSHPPGLQDGEEEGGGKLGSGMLVWKGHLASRSSVLSHKHTLASPDLFLEG